MGFLLASLTGFVLLIFPITTICLVLTYLVMSRPEPGGGEIQPTAWWGALLACIVFIPLHELLHLVLHPQGGRSDQSILVLWPAKFRFGVYYEGSMSRTRWLLMRIAPFMVLSVIPAVLWTAFQYVPYNYDLKTFISVVVVLNAVGCGGDVIAMFLVLFQVPPSASMVFRAGRAYWRP